MLSQFYSRHNRLYTSLCPEEIESLLIHNYNILTKIFDACDRRKPEPEWLKFEQLIRFPASLLKSDKGLRDLMPQFESGLFKAEWVKNRYIIVVSPKAAFFGTNKTKIRNGVKSEPFQKALEEFDAVISCHNRKDHRKLKQKTIDRQIDYHQAKIDELKKRQIG
jgi:hypothetical protein